MKVASIATFKDRLDVLPDAVGSLIDQVDIVQIYYNGNRSKAVERKIYSSLGDSNVSKVKVSFCEDMADLSKFRAIWDYPEATIFSCDDDIIYKSSYCWRLFSNLHYDHFVGCDVVSTGGKVLKDDISDVTKWRSLFSERYSFNGQSLGSHPFHVHMDIPLSGVCAFDASKFQDCEIDAKYKFAADIQLAKWCKDKGYTVSRVWGTSQGLCSYNKKMRGKETIFDSHTGKHKSVELVKELFA